MSRCRNRPQDTSQLTSHAHGRDRMSKMFQSNPPLDPKLFSSTKFFATRQVRMSGRRIRPQDTSHLTMHAHSLNRQSKVCKLDAPLDPKLFTMKFFASRQVRMLGGLIEPPDTVNPTLHAHGMDRMLPIPNPKLISKKIFCNRAMSNAWVSPQAEQYISSDHTGKKH